MAEEVRIVDRNRRRSAREYIDLTDYAGCTDVPLALQPIALLLFALLLSKNDGRLDEDQAGYEPACVRAGARGRRTFWRTADAPARETADKSRVRDSGRSWVRDRADEPSRRTKPRRCGVRADA